MKTRIVPDDLYAYGFAYERNTIEPHSKSKPDPEEVEICKHWLRTYAGVSRTYSRSSSYGLKHVVEETIEQETGARHYVSNGAFIQAAIEMGYEWRRHKDSPNAGIKLVYSWFHGPGVKRVAKVGEAIPHGCHRYGHKAKQQPEA